jgi:hypothetical protein
MRKKGGNFGSSKMWSEGFPKALHGPLTTMVRKKRRKTKIGLDTDSEWTKTIKL